ncbi:uncharacterized protein LOC112558610 [Pomacea canaliculata]|uniref:uncharacterized protein LOC112558610 n=1 Tax=Pomacea canaliculata TaxID=400727 RepID=UPI000D7390A9|nr:uncharacterized protein LOC112558610 [Pomacea canaliculata]
MKRPLRPPQQLQHLQRLLTQGLVSYYSISRYERANEGKLVTSQDMCDGCELRHGVGYKPHPSDCTLYVQCQADKNGLPVVAGVRPCPHGLYWNQDKLTCDYRHNVNCVDDICRAGAVRKTKASAASCRGYWDCNSGTALAKCCPINYSYNPYIARCTYNPTCRDDCLTSTAPFVAECPNGMRPVPGDRTKYEVKTGNTWTLMSCPANLGFSTLPCGCNVHLNTNVQQECVPELYLPFISDTQDQSGRQVFVKNEGVQVRDGKAFFDGKSRLTVPRFSNTWWGSTVTRRLALVSNGDCQVRPSLAVCAGPAGVEFYAETENSPQPVNFTVSTFDQGYGWQDGWQDVLYRLDAGSLYGHVSLNRDSRVALANLEVRQRGLVIGSGGGCDDFNGFIDEVTVYLCRPKEKDDDESTTVELVDTVTTQSPGSDDDDDDDDDTTTPVVTTFAPDSRETDDSEENEETTRTTTTTAAPTVSANTVPNMCDGCELRHGVGYKPHPSDCTLYVQCQADKNGLPVVAGVRPCPHGLYWNQDKLTCDYRHNVNCVDDICRAGAVRKTKASAASCRGYWDCNSGTALAKCCPINYSYNPYIASCTFNPTCRDDCLTSTAPFVAECPNGMRPVPGDRTKYEVKTGNTWTLMSCPANLGFSTLPCGCNVHLNTNVQQECVPELYLPFISDTQDQSGRQVFVKNEGVQVRDGKAFFDGKSRLTVPRFSNTWWGSTVYVHLRYKSALTSTRRLALVSNGDCQVRPSLAVCAGPAGVEFYAETENSPQPVNFTVSTFDQGYGWQDGWQDVLYRLDAGSLYGHVSLNRDSRVALGNLEVRQRGLVIGSGGGCDDFNGFIDEVTVYLCRPELK